MFISVRTCHWASAWFHTDSLGFSIVFIRFPTWTSALNQVFHSLGTAAPHPSYIMRSQLWTEDVTSCGEFPRENIQKRDGTSINCVCFLLRSAAFCYDEVWQCRALSDGQKGKRSSILSNDSQESFPPVCWQSQSYWRISVAKGNNLQLVYTAVYGGSHQPVVFTRKYRRQAPRRLSNETLQPTQQRH